MCLNIRGLGGNVKSRYLKELFHVEQVDMVCLKETKCSEFGERDCFLLWGCNNIDWVENGASNTSGIITMWRKSCFQLLRSFNENNFWLLKGFGRLQVECRLHL